MILTPQKTSISITSYLGRLSILARGGDRVKDEKDKSENRSVSDKERQVQHDRNNENAKARAELEPRAPRINTDNL